MSLKTNTNQAIKYHLSGIEKIKNGALDWIACGECLIKIKSELKHGEFLPYVELNLPFNRTQASKYIRFAKQGPALLAMIDEHGSLSQNEALKLLPAANADDIGYVGSITSNDTSKRDSDNWHVNMIESGATEAEATFLRSGGKPKSWTGRRVELNAMTSKQLIDWLEIKFKEHGVEKLVPDEDVLRKAYAGAYKAAKIRKEIVKIVSQFEEKIDIPEDLKRTIEKNIGGTAESWDGAIKRLATNY